MSANVLPVKLALILLWLTLTGGYAGWTHPAFLLANLSGLATLGILGLVSMRHTKPDQTESALLFFIGAMVITTVTAVEWHGLLRPVIWLGYLAVYRLAKKWHDEVIHRAARWSLIPYALISFVPWENSNIVAFNLLGLALLSNQPFSLIPAGLTIAWLGSMGGLLATGVAGNFYVRRVGLFLCLGVVALGGWWIDPASYAWRVKFWGDAWRGFISSPVWGVGPGQYYTLRLDWMHAHNIIATTAAEQGIIGLAALGWLVWVVIRRFHTLPTWAAALVAAYAAWSMVDEPLQTFGAGFIFFIALSRMKGGVVLWENPLKP